MPGSEREALKRPSVRGGARRRRPSRVCYQSNTLQAAELPRSRGDAVPSIRATGPKKVASFISDPGKPRLRPVNGRKTYRFDSRSY